MGDERVYCGDFSLRDPAKGPKSFFSSGQPGHIIKSADYSVTVALKSAAARKGGTKHDSRNAHSESMKIAHRIERTFQ